MKKFLIIIIMLLIILIFGQLIYYNFNKTNNINMSSLNNYSEDTVDKNILYIMGIYDLYKDYNPKISLENLENKFYTFVYNTIPNIYRNVEGKSIEEIEQYYEQNIDSIKSMNIYNEDDFIMIAHQINNVFDEENIIDLYNYYIDTNTISKTGSLITFKINLIYDNEEQIQIAYTISEENENVEISSSTGLDDIFKTYTGTVSKKEILNKIDSFIDKIEYIRLNSTLTTENERRQYFDLNKEELEKICITSQDDYVDIAVQINAMRWREEDLKFQSYEIKTENVTNEDYYTSFEVIIKYNYESSLDLKVSISNQASIIPNLKFSSYKK